MHRPLRIGTRGSPLALAQTEEARGHFRALRSDLAPEDLPVVVIKTTGDRIVDRPLADIGGKGLFTREIDAAMLDGAIELAVHSVKDLPTVLPDGIVLGAVLPREDVRDALIGAGSLGALPAGAVVGTASLRRQAQVLAQRPDVRVVPLRGNVQRRLDKVADGTVAATLLAMAGLKRLGRTDAATAPVPVDDMLPAVGQGAIGVTCRSGDADARDLLAALDHAPTSLCIAAERAMLTVLDGSCRTPIAGLAEMDGDGGLSLRGLVARPDGSEVITGARTGAAGDAAALGRDLGAELRARAGPSFLSAVL